MRFSDYLLSLLPGQGKEYCLQFTGPSGADAVEAALKLAKKDTGRCGVISFSGGYHGMTHGALSVTGNLSPKEAVNGMMPEVQFMPYPHEYRCPLGIGGEAGVKALTYYFENLINDVESGVRKPAAVILEAVQGEGGVNPAPAEWLQRIRKVTQEHGILLILDEVQAGFARTGKLFAFEHAGIEPDIIVMSKAVGGGLPLAVLGIKKAVRRMGAGSPHRHLPRQPAGDGNRSDDAENPERPEHRRQSGRTGRMAERQTGRAAETLSGYRSRARSGPDDRY